MGRQKAVNSNRSAELRRLMLQRFNTLLLALAFTVALSAQESFQGDFAEPRDGGNLDTSLSSFDGSTVTIVPRAHPSEAVSGGTRWRNVWFAIRGVQGKAPVFRLPLTSPGTGRVILSGDVVSFKNIKMVWSYEPAPKTWKAFDHYGRSGSNTATWTVEGRNAEPFTQDIVYVSINERSAVNDFYEWLESEVFTHAFARPTPSEVTPGSFLIGYQSGAPATVAFSREIPDMPLFGFVIKDPAATPTKLVMLVSGQHPYEGQNKVALRAAIDWILNSTTPEAKAYRAQYLTLVYPFVNPTGELAGLWRGTAFAPYKDVNRNWSTSETVPSRNRGIDTVIVHKNAMKKDIATLGLGEPYAMFDYHQNYGDKAGMPDYVLHSTYSTADTARPARATAVTDFTPYFLRLAVATGIGDAPSDLTAQETLRGYMIARGVKIPVTFERSVYNTLPTEMAFGIASVQALVDPAGIVAPTEEPPPVIDPVPTPEPTPVPLPIEPAPAPPPIVDEPAPQPELPPVVEPLPATKKVFVYDDFTGGKFLNRRLPDGVSPVGSAWASHSGTILMNAAGTVTTNNTGHATIDTGTADGVISTTVNFTLNNTGLVLRSTNSSNYLRFLISSTGWILQRTAAGSTSIIARGKLSYSTAVAHTLSATLLGSSITLAVNDVVLGTFNVTFNQTATRHGLIANGSGVRHWREFAVREL